jgi:all-trans-nonaprenyl-diphosphate synthase
MTTGNLSTSSFASTSFASTGCEPVDLVRLIEPIASEFAVVEEWLGTNLIDDNPFITELLRQVFQAGGKRIRPALTLLASKASLASDPTNDREFSRLHIILAVLTELIHTASLVHDDVIDNASLRRGTKTVNSRFNDRVAVLVGDLLFAQASICLARIMNPVIVGIYGQVLGDLCAGELSQMKQQFAVVVDWQQYFAKSVSKTASLFAAGAHSGAILNASPDAIVLALKNYGLKLGICFQMIDDLLDVVGTSEKLGKEPGSDLTGGIITAPALFVLERNDEPSKILRKLIESRAVCEEAGRQEALQLVRDYGGVEATIDLAFSFAKASQDYLTQIAPSPYREALAGLADYVLTRIS